jgi:hypothetical protein
MSTPACPGNAGPDVNTNFTGARAKRETVGSDARAVVYVFVIIAMVAVVPFALLGKHFAPNVAKDLQHQSGIFSQSGDHAGAVAASGRAVDIYRSLMRISAVQYAPKLAASLHELSIRLNEAGDDRSALAAIREAVEIRRRLAKFGAADAARLEESVQLLTRIETARRGVLPHENDGDG